jgi:hypothetical protein
MKKVTIAVIVVLLAGSALAQFSDAAKVDELSKTSGLGIAPATSPFSLLNNSRVTWSHSYSVSFFSGGSYSGSYGMLNSAMFYEVSSKLSLAFSMALAHDPGLLWGNGSQSATFLPGFMLDFHPSKNFSLRINYQRLDGANPYYYGYGIRPFRLNPY